MDPKDVRRLHRVTALITGAVLAFAVFFEIGKGSPFRAVNPFGEDPYDAVGSFAVQGTLLIGALTYARALRLRVEPTQANKARLILRGNVLGLAAILITLAADGIAELVRPMPRSFWGDVLRGGLAFMAMLALACTAALAAVFARVRTGKAPRDLTPADALDDLWTLARVPVMWAQRLLPQPAVRWVQSFDSDRFFARLPWVNPRGYPWRFACALGLLAGAGLIAVQWQEGPPPSLRIGLLLAAIFLLSELVATLAGFALLGGFLGLRPPLRPRHHDDPLSSLERHDNP